MSSKSLKPVAALELSITDTTSSVMENNTTSSKASSPPKHHHHHGLVKRILKIALVVVGVTLAFLLFYISVFPGDGSYYDALSPFSAANSQASIYNFN
ncbi:hypothetical protein M0R45_022939 [Rubus argutus]|uniref:Uncharacterized protein n=1 Tax=Rubus argutus TaxID=59490 RepID=A0AAW1WND8_RUBAR